MLDLWARQKGIDPDELENRVKLIRIEHGWNQAELAKRIEVSSTTISQIELGCRSIFGRNGRLTFWAKKLEEILAPLEELFPREVCTINKSELTSEQIDSMLNANLPSVTALENKEILKILLQRLTPRYRRIVVKHVCYGLTLEEVGVEEGITRARTSAIIAKSLRMMRHPSCLAQTGLKLKDISLD